MQPEAKTHVVVGDLLGDAVHQLAGVDEGPHGDLSGVEPVGEGLQTAVEVRHVPHVLLHLRLQPPHTRQSRF